MGTEIGDLEGYLRTTLKPVAPRSDFVDSLRSRLLVDSSPSVEQPSYLRSVLLVTLIGVGGFVLIISVVRGMVIYLQAYTHQRRK